MLVKKYRSQLVSISNSIEGVYSLEFKSLGSKYKYKPGQFLHLALDSDYDGIGQWPESRCFSMQSNSEEANIRITYAVKGAFTKQMEQTLKLGDEVWLKLPYGDLFTQPHSKENTVFIAGGTGITPFLSLFNHNSFREYKNQRVYLGFRKRAYNIYDAELKEIEPANCSVFYEDMNGMLDINNIFCENGIESSYFISGPPQMIKDFRNFLINKNVQPNNIIMDDWE